MRKLILIGVCLLSVSQLTHAALFDDKEARQQIQDLQQKTDAQNQSTQATLEAIKSRLLRLKIRLKAKI